MERRVRQKDIAELTGYSINTVSRVLRGGPGVSDVTRREILTAAERLHYITDSRAVTLKSGVSKTIAVLLPSMSGKYFSFLHYFPMILDEINHCVEARGYSTIFAQTDFGGEEQEYRTLQSVLAQNPDGIIWHPVGQSARCYEWLLAQKVPFVNVCRYNADFTVDYVVADDLRAGYLATEELIRSGHEHILFIEARCGSYDDTNTRRYDGYKQALEAYGIGSNVDRVMIGIHADTAEIYEHLQKHSEITGIVAFADPIALQVAQELLERGYKVPDDYSIVGIDNLFTGAMGACTSVDMQIREQARMAAEILLRKLEDEDEVYTHIGKVLPAKLVRGNTVKALVSSQILTSDNVKKVIFEKSIDKASAR